MIDKYEYIIYIDIMNSNIKPLKLINVHHGFPKIMCSVFFTTMLHHLRHPQWIVQPCLMGKSTVNIYFYGHFHQLHVSHSIIYEYFMSLSHLSTTTLAISQPFMTIFYGFFPSISMGHRFRTAAKLFSRLGRRLGSLVTKIMVIE